MRLPDTGRMTPQNRTMLVGSVVVILAMAGLNLALWLNPIIPETGSSAGSAAVETPTSTEKSSSGDSTASDGGGASSTQGADASRDASTADTSGSTAESSGSASVSGSTSEAPHTYLSCDPASATDPDAEADASSVPVPEGEGVDADAFRSAVASYLDENRIGCARNIHYTATDVEVRDDAGRRVWEYSCSIAGGRNDTYFIVTETGQGAYSVERE